MQANKLEQKQPSLTEVSTQSHIAYARDQTQCNTAQLSTNTKSYYSCLLKDIETKKFCTKEDSKDKRGLSVW